MIHPADLIIIVPTRSRPHHIAPVVDAWVKTNAFAEGAGLAFVVDSDDPQHEAYIAAYEWAYRPGVPMVLMQHGYREMLVPKLNRATQIVLNLDAPFAVGFAGDDHLPRTEGWARGYRAALQRLGSGFVSCPDGYRSDKLPTQWAMTADIARTLGDRQVPAPVEHLYCDDVVRDLAVSASAYEYLDDHLIEHMHPVTGKVTGDEQHRAMNAPDRYATDRRAYREWMRSADRAMAVTRIETLRKGESAP